MFSYPPFRRAAFVVLLTVAALSASSPAAHAQLASGPGGPILVAVTPDAPFGGYYAEILRAEGLNEFAVADANALTPGALAGYQVVLLAGTEVSTAQVAALDTWVQGGGNLIAMRPDARLAGLLGLGSDTGDLGEGYLRADSPGITGATMQFHGTADLWSGGGAASVATLYAGASTPTSSPAVTLRDVGASGGQAAAFGYDLARSVVYTRQGNPVWAGEKRDGQSGPIRSDDLFFPDWVNLDKVRIPQADEQQRLLANLITRMNLDRAPLPRFWYLPRGEQAAVVMTGDDHDQGGNGTRGQFGMFQAASPVGCSVADWECVRATSYAFPSPSVMSDAEAGSYQAAGFEVALHLNTGCNDYNADSLADAWATQVDTFRSTWPSVALPRTNRTHCIAWSDWAGEPKAERVHGVRLDTNYYYWPAAWVQDRPGMFTGSGFPMRFADTNGSLIDVYQAPTQITDELSTDWSYVGRHIAALLDGALGPEGYYGVFTTNMHTDIPNHEGANAIVSEALRRGVPVVSAAQMLDWLDARNGSSFQGVAFDGSQLRFTVATGAGARGLEAMVPAASAGGALLGLSRDGVPVATAPRTVKGVDYAMFVATPGTYTATYAGGGAPAAAGAGQLGEQARGVPSGQDGTRPHVSITRRRVRARRDGTIVLRVACPEAELRCLVDLRLHGRVKRLARSRFTVAGGKTAKVALRLPRATRERLARARSLDLRAVVKAKDAAGNRRTTQTQIRVLAPRRR